MNELEFCMNKCREITSPQKTMIVATTKKGNFIGVAQRSGGSTEMFPACTIGNKINIIDKAGYYQLAANVLIKWRHDE